MTTESYVPDWTEIRDAYAYQMVHYGGATLEDVRRDAERGIAKIKADALREAASAVMDERFETETEASTWLEERADRIEDGNHE